MSIFNRRNNIRAKLEPIAQRSYPEEEREEKEPLEQKQSDFSRSRFSNNNKNNGSNVQILEELPSGNRISALTHSNLISDPSIITCFPYSERFFLNFKRFLTCVCQAPKKSFVDSLKIKDVPIENDEQYWKIENEELIGKVPFLKIIESSNLELDPNVMHPFVKVHLVDVNTGNYIRKKINNKPAINYNEGVSYFGRTKKEFIRESCDFLVPFASNMYDLRENGQSRAVWNEEIYIDEDASHLFRPSLLILFELLDFNQDLIKEKKLDLMDSDFFYRVAWGYLRPIGGGRNHFGNSQIQLFKYKFQCRRSNGASLGGFVPHVYYDFIWPEKTEYHGYLSFLLLPLPPPPSLATSLPPLSVFQMETGEDLTKTLHLPNQNYRFKKEEEDENERRVRRRWRRRNELCQIPNKILFKFQTAKEGCFRVRFSNEGKYLAAACTGSGSKTIIKIFDMEDGTMPFVLRGHRNLVHDLDWSMNDRFLISSSSDYSSKIWKIPRSSGETFDEEESEKRSLLCQLNHPSYVYGGRIMPEPKSRRIVIATICFDGKVRVWMVTMKERDQYDKQELLGECFLSVDDPPASSSLLDHRHPNALYFNENGRLIVGDSLGYVHVYDIKVKFRKFLITLVNRWTHPDIENDPINSVYISKADGLIIVHSRDNCIRAFEDNENGKRIHAHFFGSKSSRLPIRSSISPDSSYLLSGSETGQPVLWSFETRLPLPVDSFETSFASGLCDVDWSTNFHMIALSGFGSDYPLLVYCWEKEEGKAGEWRREEGGRREEGRGRRDGGGGRKEGRGVRREEEGRREEELKWEEGRRMEGEGEEGGRREEWREWRERKEEEEGGEEEEEEEGGKENVRPLDRGGSGIFRRRKN